FYFSLVVVLSFFFFFSSRRRHTRSKRDWSSDVCSSDLLPPFLTRSTAMAFSSDKLRHTLLPVGRALSMSPLLCFSFSSNQANVRSEERRVGKECRYRWSLDH